MEPFAQIVNALRENPTMAGAAVAAIIAGYAWLHRRPRIQREADERLSALRRDKADQYSKLRPPH